MTSERIAEIVNNVYHETGWGPSREELAEIIDYPNVRTLPGVRMAQRDGLVEYDSHRRLVPAKQ